MKNDITQGTRVWSQEINGPLLVTSIDSNKANCSHEFLPIHLTLDISSLNLLDIKQPNIGFCVSFKENEYPCVSTSNYFENYSSPFVSIHFFYAILQRTINYLKCNNYDIGNIMEFRKDLTCYIIEVDNGDSDYWLKQAINKYKYKLPRDYNNSLMILSSDSENLTNFFIGKYTNESLLISFFMLTDYIKNDLPIEMAEEVMHLLFNDLRDDYRSS